MSDLITAAVSGVFALMICIIEARASRDRKRTESCTAARIKESRLAMKMQDANTMLGLVTAKAVTHQHVNGDVEEAIKAAETAQKEYHTFVEEIATEHLTK